MKRPIIVSVVNHKGGCLKTTVTANLGAALSRSGQRVLIVDIDAQQNLTQSLIGPVVPAEGELTLYDALVEELPLDSLVRPTSEPHLDIIPCTEEFAAADMTLVSAMGREMVLKGCLERSAFLSSYDFILIDNPPSISLVVVNSLVASDYFLVPCSAEFLPMIGLTLLGNSVARLQKLAPSLSLLGVVLTGFARTERICNHVGTMLKKELGDRLFETRIRVNTKAKSAPSKRMNIFEYEGNPKGRGTEDFTALAAEFLKRVEEERQEAQGPEAVAASG